MKDHLVRCKRGITIITKVLSAMLCTVFALLFGIIIDISYLMQDTNCVCGWIIKVLKQIFKFLRITGITYDSAFGVLNSSVGIMLAMVSIFITMNINMVQRSENKVMGIPYREILYLNQKAPFNFIMKMAQRIGYIAPAFMLIILNIHFCATGYLLFVYCYVAVLIHYYLHISSYSLSENIEKVATTLVNCLPDDTYRGGNGLQDYDMNLDRIGNYVAQNENWAEVEKVFYEFTNQLGCTSAVYKHTILEHFCKRVYWGNRRGDNYTAIMGFWKMIIDTSDLVAAKSGITEDERVVLETVTQVTFSESDDDKILIFLDYFRQFDIRTQKVCQRAGKPLPEQFICEESALILILVEYRLRVKFIANIKMGIYLRDILVYAKKFFLIESQDAIPQWEKILGDMDGGILIQIWHDFIDDLKNGTSLCCISNVLKEN